jgi:hypothetical protein
MLTVFHEYKARQKNLEDAPPGSFPSFEPVRIQSTGA